MSSTEEENRKLCKEIWLSNEPRLRKLCDYKLSSRPDFIEDVLSETALILWSAIMKDKTIGNYDAWLYGTTNNLIKKKYQEIGEEKETRIAFDDNNLKTYNLSLGYNIDNERLTDDSIEKFIEDFDGELTPEEKQLYKYVYEDKLKMKEIASLLSSTESAVKQKNYRLTRKIKRLMKSFLEKS